MRGGGGMTKNPESGRFYALLAVIGLALVLWFLFG